MLFHSQKTRDSHEKPNSEFPTLENSRALDWCNCTLYSNVHGNRSDFYFDVKIKQKITNYFCVSDHFDELKGQCHYKRCSAEALERWIIIIPFKHVVYFTSIRPNTVHANTLLNCAGHRRAWHESSVKCLIYWPTA